MWGQLSSSMGSGSNQHSHSPLLYGAFQLTPLHFQTPLLGFWPRGSARVHPEMWQRSSVAGCACICVYTQAIISVSEGKLGVVEALGCQNSLTHVTCTSWLQSQQLPLCGTHFWGNRLNGSSLTQPFNQHVNKMGLFDLGTSKEDVKAG
ncbi:unnamed protein product [Leuciscus chuanchicus]